MTLREKAARALQEERDAVIAQEIARRAEQWRRDAERLCRRLGACLGLDIDPDTLSPQEVDDRTPRVTVDGITFYFRERAGAEGLHLARACPRCGGGVPGLPISSLADLGSALEKAPRACDRCDGRDD